MILKFKQTDRENDHDFVLLDKNNNIYCKGKTQSNAFTIAASIVFEDEKFMIYGDFSKNINEQPMQEKSGFSNYYTANEYMNANRAKIFNSENIEVGIIKRQKVDAKVLFAEKYIFNYNNASYQGYYVAKPMKGLYYFIVDENRNTVAAIKQKVTAVNYYFEYTIYAENDYYAKLAALFLVYADNHVYGGKWTYSGYNIVSETTLVAQPKEVKDRYDYAFIKQIKSME